MTAAIASHSIVRKALLLSGSLVAIAASAQPASAGPPTLLFVCGGNTGRSVMSEWRARSLLASSPTPINVFSRGSGIDPMDEPEMETLAMDYVKSDGGTEEYTHRHRGTPVNIVDLAKADVVLTAGASHRDRLNDIIDFQCSAAWIAIKKKWNKDPDGTKASTRSWTTMCTPANITALKAKIKTIVGCATGTDGDIADGFDADEAFKHATDYATKDTHRTTYQTGTRAAIEKHVGAIAASILLAPTEPAKWCCTDPTKCVAR